MTEKAGESGGGPPAEANVSFKDATGLWRSCWEEEKGVKTLISLSFPTYLPPGLSVGWPQLKPDNKRWVDGGHRAGVKRWRVDLKEQRTTSSPLPLCSFEGNHQDIHLGKCRDHLPITQLENQTFFFFFFFSDSRNLGFFNRMLMPGKENNFRTDSGCMREVARRCQQQASWSQWENPRSSLGPLSTSVSLDYLACASSKLGFWVFLSLVL